MDIMHSAVPFYALLAPLAGAFLILLAGHKRPNLREFLTMLASITMFVSIMSMIPDIISGRLIECRIIEIYAGISLLLRVDALGMIFAVLAASLWIVVSVYSIGYMRSLHEHAQTRFFFCFAMALFGATGVALSGNLLTLYMFYEILTISTFPLVVHKETPEAMRAGRKYLVYLLSGAVFVLFSMGFTYYLTGTLDFVAGGFMEGKGSAEVLRLVFAAFIIGFGTKAALMPFHEWLPSAMIAPTPVSALLHAVAVVKAGVFCVLRIILYVYGPELLTDLSAGLILAYAVSFTVIVANIIALTQDNLKARLAFSTINNLAVIILGASLLSSDGVKGSLLHMPFHGFMKITLFMCAGAIYVKTRKERVSEMGGIGNRMPVTMGAFTLGTAGIVGVPPMCGFISKWYLCLGTLQAQEIIFLFVFLVSALLDAAYFFPIVYNAYFKGHEGKPQKFDEAPLPMIVPIGVTAAVSVILGIFPDLFFRFLTAADLVVRTVYGGI
jgi:multicomponent Na+:H+ antiporter subunit D